VRAIALFSGCKRMDGRPPVAGSHILLPTFIKEPSLLTPLEPYCFGMYIRWKLI